MDQDDVRVDLSKEKLMDCWSDTHLLSPVDLPLRDLYSEYRKRRRSGSGADEEEGHDDGSDDDGLDHSEDLQVKKLAKTVGTLQKKVQKLESVVKELKRNERKREKALKELLKQAIGLLSETGNGATTSDE